MKTVPTRKNYKNEITTLPLDIHAEVKRNERFVLSASWLQNKQ